MTFEYVSNTKMEFHIHFYTQTVTEIPQTHSWVAEKKQQSKSANVKLNIKSICRITKQFKVLNYHSKSHSWNKFLFWSFFLWKSGYGESIRLCWKSLEWYSRAVKQCKTILSPSPERLSRCILLPLPAPIHCEHALIWISTAPEALLSDPR